MLRGQQHQRGNAQHAMQSCFELLQPGACRDDMCRSSGQQNLCAIDRYHVAYPASMLDCSEMAVHLGCPAATSYSHEVVIVFLARLGTVLQGNFGTFTHSSLCTTLMAESYFWFHCSRRQVGRQMMLVSRLLQRRKAGSSASSAGETSLGSLIADPLFI